MYNEILKLRNLLISEDIPHTFDSLWGGFQIKMYADEAKTRELDDVICHPYSHGSEMGLLETYRLNNCLGYETAGTVFEGWKKMYKKAREI